MMALETLASSRSESLTAPTPWPTILIATTGSSIFCSAASSASSVPCASALTTRLSSLTSPSLARRARSSRVMRGATSRAAATALEVGVDDRPDRVAVGVRLQLEDIGRKHDRRQQVVDAQAGPRAEVNALVLTAVVPCDDALLGQLLMDAVDVGVFLVDLVDGDDDRHVRGARVVDRLDRLRHHAVVGGHDQDNEVGDLGAPGAHGGERLVARRVDEHDWMPIGGFDLVGADPLGD